MEIKKIEITIQDLVNGYSDNEDGIYGFGGKLNIRPAFQREFVYNNSKRNAVLESVINHFPLSTFYWSDNEDGTYELLDGQQRTISICSYIAPNNPKRYSYDFRFWHNLNPEEQENILSYKIDVYICKGTTEEKLKWFKVINIAGEQLTNQELRNAIYTGPWLNDAKRYFSKTKGPIEDFAKKYMKGTAIRQDYLESIIKWISNDNIEEYMAEHQFDQNANKLWAFFNAMKTWVLSTFPNYRKEMKGVQWGKLFIKYGDNFYDTEYLENETIKLMLDDDVTKKSGIYEYLLSEKENEKVLNIRAFTANQKREAYERQNRICPICGEHFDFDEMEGDHIIPWSKGGKTISDNCQMLCRNCNRKKQNI